MTAPPLDLSELDSVDLAALRLGAQVMAHKAELASRPRVDTFFRRLMLTVDDEIARRRRSPDDRPLVSPADLPLAGLGPPTGSATDDDRALTGELLDLLGANERLSPPVRQVCRVLREHVAGSP